MNNGRLEKQLGFILEIDKLKKVERKTLLTDGSRMENSAEHSWNIALMALVLSEYAAEADIDFFAPALWERVEEIIRDAAQKGILKE